MKASNPIEVLEYFNRSTAAVLYFMNERAIKRWFF